MTDWIIIGLLLALLAAYIFDLRLKSKADDATLEDVLEDLVTEIREIPGDFIEKLIESKLLEGLKPTVEAKPTPVAPKSEEAKQPEAPAPEKKLSPREVRQLAKDARQQKSKKPLLPENKLADIKKGFAEAKKNANGQNIGLTFKVMKTKTSKFEEVTLRGTKDIEKFIKEADDKGYIVQ